MRFRVYRWDVSGRPYVFQGACATVEQVLGYPFQDGEEYRVLVDHKKSYSLAEFRALAMERKFVDGDLP